MRPKVSVYIATSLDGYIARPDGDIAWLHEGDEHIPEGEDFGYGELMDSVDALVMGRHTYEKVLTFGAWPYGEKRVVVLSSQSLSFPDDAPEALQQSSEPPSELCERLGQEGVKHIYIDGGKTVQRFLAAGLVDEMTITLIPVLLGEGIPLFGHLDHDIRLTHVSTKSWEFGLVQLRYEVTK